MNIPNVRKPQQPPKSAPIKFDWFRFAGCMILAISICSVIFATIQTI